ncbi:MAG TPA: hypothetical protein VJZ27_04940 [Aggregatilineales bacterium]|nr:hypothetical protein [Aggregatilineales bacterium]
MKHISIIIALILLVSTGISGVLAQDDQNTPIIISFTSGLDKVTLAEAEAGSKTTTLSWKILNMSEAYSIMLYAYEIRTWVPLLDENADPLEAEDSLQVAVRHPLNFNPPTYLLRVINEAGSYSDAIVSIPYDEAAVVIEPAIASFVVTQTDISADELAYGEPRVIVSWRVTDRTPTTNLAFEQVLPDGTINSVELPRLHLWVPSSGQGPIQPIYPPDGNIVALRLKLTDLETGATLDEAGQVLNITGTRSTPTPAPTNRPQPTAQPQQEQQQNPPQVAQNQSAPVVGAGTSGGFELGGHISSFGSGDVARSAGMNWVKKQVRWNRGEGTGAAAGIINSAHGAGFKVMLGIVGYRDQMGDFDAYSNEFAAYLGQVAALGPDAIEVWNEPNIDREWPAGTISGENYTTLLAKAYNAIKSTNSGVMVISAAPAPTGFFGGCATAGCDDNVFLRQMANAGAAQYFDCIGAHYNEGIISPDQTSGDPRGGHYTRYFLSMLNLYYNTFGGARKVCWTELGYLTPEGYAPLPGGFAWAQNTTLGQQAEWLGRAVTLSRQSGRVRLMIIWNVDFQVYDSDPQAGYAIIRADGGCPACGTLSAAMQ